jgi:hypothetical protein
VKRKFTLRFDETKNKWVLKHDPTEKIIRVFKSKEDSTRAGVLRRVLGQQGGTVIVRTKTGTFEEERNFREMRG